MTTSAASASANHLRRYSGEAGGMPVLTAGLQKKRENWNQEVLFTRNVRSIKEEEMLCGWYAISYGVSKGFHVQDRRALAFMTI